MRDVGGAHRLHLTGRRGRSGRRSARRGKGAGLARDRSWMAADIRIRGGTAAPHPACDPPAAPAACANSRHRERQKCAGCWKSKPPGSAGPAGADRCPVSITIAPAPAAGRAPRHAATPRTRRGRPRPGPCRAGPGRASAANASGAERSTATTRPSMARSSGNRDRTRDLVGAQPRDQHAQRQQRNRDAERFPSARAATAPARCRGSRRPAPAHDPRPPAPPAGRNRARPPGSSITADHGISAPRWPCCTASSQPDTAKGPRAARGTTWGRVSSATCFVRALR